MSKLASHLQKHLRGEVLDSQHVREHFSTDGSIFKVIPRLVVYPHDVEDVQKVARFSWQLAEHGRTLPITSRGKGTDQGGGALGSGIILAITAHLNRMLHLDKQAATVQTGLLFGDLQRTLHSHGRFLPPFPASVDFSTIGGALANNTCGEKTVKYGSMADFVESLQVVLANGQVITANKLSKRELHAKKGFNSFEGEIYRKLDGLLIDNSDIIKKSRRAVSKNAAGYNVWDIKQKDGSFDLTKLLVGSQGTLGIITGASLKTCPYNPEPSLLVSSFNDLNKASEAALALKKLKPSALEVIDYHLLKLLQQNIPEQLAGLIEGELPKMLMLVEFDDLKARARGKRIKRAKKLLQTASGKAKLIPDKITQEYYWRLRHSAAAVIWRDAGTKKALPVIEDGVVPVERMAEFINKVYDLLKKHHLEIAVWGHAGDANFHLQPLFDLDNVGDRQKVFRIMDDFYKIVINLGGSTSGGHNDGRLRAPYLKDLYGEELYNVFREIKQIFDPFGIMNPGVKIDVTKESNVQLLRREYSVKHLYDHIPTAL